jgi:ankyrin repeat protein
MQRNENLAKKILQHSPDVDRRDRPPNQPGHTPLELACQSGCSDEMFEQLLVRSKALHNKNPHGLGLLHISSRSGLPFVTKLLEAGFFVDETDGRHSLTPSNVGCLELSCSQCENTP